MTEDTFVSHLVELRDRSMRSLIAILIGFALLWIWPGYGALYDFLALPLIQTLPPGPSLSNPPTRYGSLRVVQKCPYSLISPAKKQIPENRFCNTGMPRALLGLAFLMRV